MHSHTERMLRQTCHISLVLLLKSLTRLVQSLSVLPPYLNFVGPRKTIALNCKYVHHCAV